MLLGVLALLVVVKVQQPGSLFAVTATAETFPKDLVVTAAPTTNIYGDRAELRVLQLVDSMNAMWARAFAAAGDEYERPRVESAAGRPAEGCGSAEEGWAGVYCPRDRAIVIDVGHQQVRRAVIGEEGADALLGYVLAHEIGHHVQTLRGNRHVGAPEDVLRGELHAECLAGVWGRAAGHRPPPAWTYASDAEHGTAAQQRHWLERGHARGRPGDCDAIWTAPVMR